MILKVIKNPAKSPKLTRAYEIMFGFIEVFIEAVPTVLIQIVIMYRRPERPERPVMAKERCQLKKHCDNSLCTRCVRIGKRKSEFSVLHSVTLILPSYYDNLQHVIGHKIKNQGFIL